MKKKIIWSNMNINYDEWQSAYEEDRDNGYVHSDLYTYVNDTLSIYLGDERINLNKGVDGVIVCFVDLQRWNGRYSASGIVGENVSNILSSNCEFVEWYCDRYNVRSTETHHDGTNTLLFRVVKDRQTAEDLAYKVAYEGMSEKEFMRRTKSLRPYVAKVYGW